jgi:phage shock protein A
MNVHTPAPLDEEFLLRTERAAYEQLADEHEAHAAWLEQQLQAMRQERDEARNLLEATTAERDLLRRHSEELMEQLEPLERVRRVARRVPGGVRLMRFLRRVLR